MPNKRIDQLNLNLNPLTGSELIPIFDIVNDTTERITLNTLSNYIGSGGTYVTGGTYSNGTLTLNSQDNSITITGFTDYYTTGVTLNGNVLEFNRTDISNAYSVDLSSIKFTGNTSGNCITDIFVTNVNSCSPLHIQPTNSGDVYIVENGGNVGIGTTTPNNILDVIGDVYVSNSLSATTLYGDGSNLTGVSGTPLTGGTYLTGGTLVFGYGDGNGFQVTGLTTDLYKEIDGLADADGQTLELDITTNVVRLKDTIEEASGGTRLFLGTLASPTFSANTIYSDIIIMKSPDGTPYKLTIDNGGTISVLPV